MNEDSIAKGLNESPLTFRLWTTMGRLNIERMKELSLIKLRIEDVVVVRGFLSMRRGNGRNITTDIERRRRAEEPLWSKATGRVADDAVEAGGDL